MEVLGLTTYSQIRAVLTVSEADLPDEVLSNYGVEDDLSLELEEWLPDWEKISDARLSLHLRLFSKYYCASTVGATASIFVLTKMTDGENEGQRSPEKLQKMIKGLEDKAQAHKAALVSSVSGTVASPSIISISTPSRDVITESR